MNRVRGNKRTNRVIVVVVPSTLNSNSRHAQYVQSTCVLSFRANKIVVKSTISYLNLPFVCEKACAIQIGTVYGRNLVLKCGFVFSLDHYSQKSVKIYKFYTALLNIIEK